jgi:hypothetical protein
MSFSCGGYMKKVKVINDETGQIYYPKDQYILCAILATGKYFRIEYL